MPYHVPIMKGCLDFAVLCYKDRLQLTLLFIGICHLLQLLPITGQSFLGPDTYREGYSGGKLDANLVLWKPYDGAPEGGRFGDETKPQVEIKQSSRHKYPTKEQPKESQTINEAFMIIDDSLKTYWWSALDERQSWIEINLGNPIVRIQDVISRDFFIWKYQDNIDSAVEIHYLKETGGLCGFHIDQVTIYWAQLYAARDYKVMSSVDRIQWKDRSVQIDMPNLYDRVDVIPGWSTQGIGNTRYIRFVMVDRVTARNEWGNCDRADCTRRRRLLQAPANEETVYGIREIVVTGPEPSSAARPELSNIVALAFIFSILNRLTSL